jgi:hypothetical protein
VLSSSAVCIIKIETYQIKGNATVYILHCTEIISVEGQIKDKDSKRKKMKWKKSSLEFFALYKWIELQNTDADLGVGVKITHWKP